MTRPRRTSQAAVVAALNGPQDLVAQRCAEFQARRDALLPLLDAIPGLLCARPDGAFYRYISCAGWIGRRTPAGLVLATDADVVAHLLESGVSSAIRMTQDAPSRFHTWRASLRFFARRTWRLLCARSCCCARANVRLARTVTTTRTMANASAKATAAKRMLATSGITPRLRKHQCSLA